MLRLSSHARLDATVAGKAREQVNETERIVHVPQCVREAGVPLADQVMQGVLGRQRRLLPPRLVLLVAIGGLAHALHERLEQAKLFEQRFVSQGSDVLQVIEDLTLLVAGGASAGLARIHTLKDAKPAEVLQRNLELLEDLGPADEGGVEAGVILLADLAHAGELAMGGHAGMDSRLDGLLLGAALDPVSHDFRLLVRGG